MTDRLRVTALSCPSCGGRLEMTARAELFRCAYCNGLALVRWPVDDASAAPSGAKVEARQRWAANLLRPGARINWQGGELLLTRHELVFVPHGLNVGPIERAVLPLGAIASIALVEGFISDDVTMTDASGLSWGVRVRSGKELRAVIERARAEAG